MHQFRIDFAMNRGHEMTIDRESGIVRSELDEIELNMLRSQRVPYLLPMDWFEMDGKVTFRYALTGTKMLVHRLQQQPMTMEQYYSLILAVTDALLECKEYMLRPEGCLLNDQFIFVGERICDISLVYLPLKGNEEDYVQKTDDLLSLIVRWTSYVEPIDGHGLKRILQLLNNSRWPLLELRETLLDLIAGPTESIAWRKSDTAVDIPSISPELQERKRESVEYKRQIENKEMDLDAHEDIMPFIEDEFELERSNSKNMWVMGAAMLIACACAWRFIYLESPSSQSILISSGITLLLIALFLYLRRRGSDLLMTKMSSFEESDVFEPHSGSLRSKRQWDIDDEQPPNTTDSMGSYSVPTKMPVSQLNGVNFPPTTVMGVARKEENSTTVLGSFESNSTWLKRVWNGQEEEIELANDSFKIGRSTEGVSYAESAEGVSRIHLEIEQVDGEHHAKDLGSRNGTLLNGNLMVPYKAYKLMKGDTIHLAGKKGPVYELQSG